MTVVEEELLAGLAEVAGAYGDGVPVTLATRTDGLVVRVGDAVAKAHPAGTDPERLATRVRISAVLGEILLAPLRPAGGDWVT
ncbi:MAG: hypothetical protein ACRDTM_15995, partial [Micromonosporaceae bacterium]